MKKNTWAEVPGYPELRIGQYIVPNFVSNSLAVHNGEGHWTVLSPGATLLAGWETMVGESFASLSLVMPNHFHFMGVKDWLKVYPDAKLYASAQAIPRLVSQGLDGVEALESRAPLLPEGYRFYFPPGHRAGDVWLCREGEKGVWITCDSFLNYARLSNQPFARFLQKLLGAAPGLKMSQVIKRYILNDRKAFKVWALEHLQKNPPKLLIPGHGEPEQSETLAVRLNELLVRL